eukprot:TRINITY_DN13254_c0_g1_i3.p2 TRINITY_DN13254_c0_g1~~TRINITY_DN13254_c0_g1_i3.p2  ORF type:complete len:117 (+),score=28.94 TRINITY_DN13254_c0_g1_i3:138-488(+)
MLMRRVAAKAAAAARPTRPRFVGSGAVRDHTAQGEVTVVKSDPVAFVSSHLVRADDMPEVQLTPASFVRANFKTTMRKYLDEGMTNLEAYKATSELLSARYAAIVRERQAEIERQQ